MGAQGASNRNSDCPTRVLRDSVRQMAHRGHKYVSDVLGSPITMDKSEFLRLYDKTNRNPSLDEVINSLRTVNKLAAQDLSKYGNPCGQSCARLWTGNRIYKQVNDALANDDASQLRAYMPFIRALNRWIQQNLNKEELILWRGSKVVESVAEDLKIGGSYRNMFYVAASEDKAVANKFKKTYLIQLRIPKGCMNCSCLLSSISEYSDEVEHLIPPWTVFTLTKRTSSTLFYDVHIDNKVFENKIELFYGYVDGGCFLEQEDSEDDGPCFHEELDIQGV